MTPHDNPFDTTTPVNRTLARLLADAATRLGLDDAAAADVASRGALLVNDIALFAFNLAAATPVGYDTLVVASLGDLRLDNLTQAQLVLHTNMTLGPLSGFTFASTPDGELQLFRGLAPGDVDGESLARTFVQLAGVAGTIRDQLIEIAAPRDKAATPRDPGAST